ncbi:MAG: beta-lactamase family protein [Oscillospiraceae bacterium]|jgi:CubicO group peptidase (beta-lactamase class C family)|nr:beta-lactamase family protein [Oscillospiraceae bacterium]
MNNIKSIPAALEFAADSVGVCIPRLAYLDAYLQRMIDDKKHVFTGWRVLRKGSLIFSGEYGTQNPGGDPLRSDAIYPLQSATKPVLATCAAILQEDGYFDFYEQLQKYRPEFIGAGKNEVLMWQLLCHTSGIDDEAQDKYELKIIGEVPRDAPDGQRSEAFKTAREKLGLAPVENPLSDAATEEVYGLIALRAPLASKPGTKFSYSSYCYELIKSIIEEITGETLEQFAKRKIFDPLGMSDTHWFLPAEKRERFVIRDESCKGGGWINSEYSMTSASAAGGLKSTLDDMAKFGQMWLNEGTYNGARILSPATVRMMTRDHNSRVPDSDWFGRVFGASWGLGWDLKCDKTDDHGFLRSARSYNHGGYGGACILVDPDYDLVISCYFCEQAETSQNDDLGPAINTLYSSFN